MKDLKKVMLVMNRDYGWSGKLLDKQKDFAQDLIKSTKQVFSLNDVVKPFVCELKEFGRQDKPCDKQCSSCKWFEDNAN